MKIQADPEPPVVPSCKRACTSDEPSGHNRRAEHVDQVELPSVSRTPAR